MNYTKKQKAMIKLAQVRLAINHVIRKRAMSKCAQVPLAPVPEGTNWNGWTGFFNVFNPMALRAESQRGAVLERNRQALLHPNRRQQRQPQSQVSQEALQRSENFLNRLRAPDSSASTPGTTNRNRYMNGQSSNYNYQ